MLNLGRPQTAVLKDRGLLLRGLFKKKNRGSRGNLRVTCYFFIKINGLSMMELVLQFLHP